MTNMKKTYLYELLVAGGVASAAITFAMPLFNDYFNFKGIDESTIKVSTSIKDGNITIFVRNESSEPLDLVSARIFAILKKDKTLTLGAYPESSRVYTVKINSERVDAKVESGIVNQKFPILQVVEAGGFDRFDISISSRGIPIEIDHSDFTISLTEINGLEFKGK